MTCQLDIDAPRPPCRNSWSRTPRICLCNLCQPSTTTGKVSKRTHEDNDHESFSILRRRNASWKNLVWEKWSTLKFNSEARIEIYVPNHWSYDGSPIPVIISPTTYQNQLCCLQNACDEIMCLAFSIIIEKGVRCCTSGCRYDWSIFFTTSFVHPAVQHE